MILWVKMFHILFVIAWMAGAFYSPRILVHYIEGRDLGEDVRRLVIMGERLSKFSALMASLAIISGLWLWIFYGFRGNWLHAKLGFVILLIFYQVQTYVYTKKMTNNLLVKTSFYLRLYNEAALIFLIPILYLVVFKPF